MLFKTQTPIHRRPLRIAIALVSVVLLDGNVQAAPVSFVKIIDNATDFYTFSTLVYPYIKPAINNHGTVAFWGDPVNGTHAIFTGNGGPLTKIIDYAAPENLLLTERPHINDAGTVVFTASAANGTSGVYTGNGGPLTTVEDSTGPRQNFWLYEAYIINSGAVAFTAQRDTGNLGRSAYVNNGGVTSLIAENTGGALSTYAHYASADYNNNGQVALQAKALSGPSQAIFIGSGGALTLVAQRTGFTDRLVSPSINDAGDVVYIATPGNGLSLGVYKYSGGVTTQIIAPPGSTGFAVSSEDQAQINNQGMIAYSDSDKHAIFLGNGSTFSRVIGFGDSLFGSTVTTIGKWDMNDRGDVAFVYGLASGREGIAVATMVPEPTALLLAIVAFAAIGGTRRLR